MKRLAVVMICRSYPEQHRYGVGKKLGEKDE